MAISVLECQISEGLKIIYKCMALKRLPMRVVNTTGTSFRKFRIYKYCKQKAEEAHKHIKRYLAYCFEY